MFVIERSRKLRIDAILKHTPEFIRTNTPKFMRELGSSVVLVVAKIEMFEESKEKEEAEKEKKRKNENRPPSLFLPERLSHQRPLPLYMYEGKGSSCRRA